MFVFDNFTMRSSRPSVRLWSPAVAALALAIFITGFVVDSRNNQLRNDMMADFSYESREITLRIAEQITGYRQILRGARSVLTLTGQITQEQWTSYVANLYLNRDYPGMQTLGYAPRIQADQLGIHTQRVRSTAFPDYQVWPQSERRQMAPVVRLEPMSGNNSRLIGFDLSSDPSLEIAMSHSGADGKTAMSAQVDAKVPVAETLGSQVFMFQPLYTLNLPPPLGSTNQHPPEQEKSLAGWVFGTFRVAEMIKKTLEPLPQNMHLQIFAGLVIDPKALMYDSQPHAEKINHDSKVLEVVVPLQVEGQTWTLLFQGFPRAYNSDQGVFSGELLAVVIICLLFGMSAVLATVSRQRAIKLTELAKELEKSNSLHQFMATHDTLTKAANRLLFQQKLDALVIEATRYKHRFAVIYIDLDKFKQINDTLGHEAGDQVLIEATNRLSTILRSGDLVARRGGDEFVVLLPQIEEGFSIYTVADKICSILAQPIPLGDNIGSISGSLGVALFPDDGTDAEVLVQTADRRMYRAKQKGRNCWIADDLS